MRRCAEPLPIVESYSHRAGFHGRNSDGEDVVRQHESDIIEDVSVHLVELIDHSLGLDIWKAAHGRTCRDASFSDCVGWPSRQALRRSPRWFGDFMFAECHSTGVRKNFDAANNRYYTAAGGD
jgi:hypothetical protein